MLIDFKINMLLENKRQSIIYSLSKEESYSLIDCLDIDFLNIPPKTELVTLTLDILFEEKEIVKSIIQILSDMFPSTLLNFKSKLKNKGNIIDKYIDRHKIAYINNKNDVIIELDKIFMIFYILMNIKDSSNLNRNILRKMGKIGLVTINCIPLVKTVNLTIPQLLDVRKNAVFRGKIKDNFFILEADKLKKEKWKNDNTDYYIYLYRKSVDFVQNEKKVFYVIIKPKIKEIDNNILIDYRESAVNHKNLLRCQLFKEICENTRPFRWKEVLGILSNLKNIKIKFENNSMLAVSYIVEHIPIYMKRLVSIVTKFIRANNSCKQECNEFCPYSKTCHHTKTMLDTVYIKKDKIVKLDKAENYVTLKEAREDLGKKAESLYNKLVSGKIEIGLLTAQQGLGKTEKVIELINTTIKNGKGCIYAVPYRKTIENFKQRLEEKGFSNYLITPVLENLTDKKINKEVEYLQEVGAYTKLKIYLSKQLNKDNLKKEDKEKIEEYLKINEDIKKYDGLIITTHKRFPFFSEKVYENKIAFIDEDIFDSDFVSVTTMPLQKIEDVIDGSLILKQNGYEKLDIVKKIKNNMVTPIFSMSFDSTLKKLIEDDLMTMRNNPINIFDFYSCIAVKKYYDGYKYKVKCFNFRELLPIPTLITSATAEEEFYHLYFGNSIRIKKVKKAKYEGRIKLWDSHTYSQQFLSNDENLKYIEELIEICRMYNMNLITFKDFIEKNQSVLIEGEETTSMPKLLDGISCYNFFSILGLDTLKDKNLAVIGKPLKDEDIFYFLAYLVYKKIYQETTFEEQRCKIQIVEDKGFLFNLYTYNDKILRKIQMWSISSNEEQYTGRARVISQEDRTVYLASGYPVEQMEIEDEEE